MDIHPPPEPPVNTSFSTQLPTLQLAIDSTSLGEYKICPRKYYYRLICGWVPRTQSVHLQFGLYLHQARETYERSKSAGADHQTALRAAIRRALSDTWDRTTERPWWSGHPTKNRLSLIRTIVWYLDQFGLNDTLQTITLSNGQPAVELTFNFDSGLTACTGESFTLCGHIDRLVQFNAESYVSDIKTASMALGQSYFAQYSPDNQVSLYSVAGQIAFHTPISGVIIDGIQIGATFSRFERQIIPRTPHQLEEWLSDTAQWLKQMQYSAVTSYWPMNDKACHHYGGCPYRGVCSRPPYARQKWLETDYTKQIWDPSIARTA